MYIPSKPDKYGIKRVMMCDAETSYMCNALPFLGKEIKAGNKNEGKPKSGHSKECLKPTKYVLQLTASIQGTNWNVTLDNWFTSVKLADQLQLNELNMVGTLRRNKKGVSSSFIEEKHKNIPSSAFAFTKKENRSLNMFFY
ncbi:hypothetical protein JTB14_018512 [Gonioctena quinquepunctata]|nr:hypothetical protein JTB14_018512 [Gonioctena quinquepunctata]